MARAGTAESLTLVLRTMHAFPEGASVDQLASALRRIPRRTLQRRLAQLIEDGRVRIAGRG